MERMEPALPIERMLSRLKSECRLKKLKPSDRMGERLSAGRS